VCEENSESGIKEEINSFKNAVLRTNKKINANSVILYQKKVYGDLISQ
jgi:hypothetical protein